MGRFREVTAADRADLWGQVALLRLHAGDPDGAARATRLAEENHDLDDWNHHHYLLPSRPASSKPKKHKKTARPSRPIETIRSI